MTTTGNISTITAPGLTIGGDVVTATDRTEVINPATAQAFVAVPAAGPPELENAVQAAGRRRAILAGTAAGRAPGIPPAPGRGDPRAPR